MIKTGEKAGRPFHKVRNIIDRVNGAVTEKWLVPLCVFSLFSSFADMPLSFLSIVIMQTAKGRMTKYICGAVSALYFLSTVTQTAFYIPYIAFLFIYLAADYLLENHSLKSVYPAVFTFVVVKGYLLSFGYEISHWVLFAAEIVMLIFLAPNATAGFDLLKNNENCQSAENIYEAFSALALVAFSLEGVSVWGISFSAVFLLGTAVFYGTKNNFVLSFIALFVMVISLCQRENFALLCGGFAVIYLSAVFFVPKGIKGYTAHLTVTAAVTMLFIPYFNSIEFFSTTAASLAVCLYADRFSTIGNVLRPVSDEFTGERDYIQLKENLEKLNRCFRFLGYTVIDISNLMVKEFVPSSLEDTVCTEVCRKCKNNTFCWQENFSETQKQFSRYASYLSNGKTPFFDSWFSAACEQMQQLQKSFENHNRLISTQKLIHQQGKHNQKLLQNQFLAMASILQEIANQGSMSGVANTAFTHKANNFLLLMGKKVNYCICYQNRNRCIVSTREAFDGDESYKFKSKLESLYGAKFNMPTVCNDGENTVYTFSQVPMFNCEYGAESAGRYANCGDVCEYFVTDRWAYVILADGMGTGSFAAAESKTAVVMLKNLLTAAVKAETALEITNTALNLKGTGQSCVAVDILQIDLYDGHCNLYKAGGAPTVITGGDKSRLIYKDSLPIGVLKETKATQFSFVLNNGDTVVLTSDGVGIGSDTTAKLKLACEKCTSQQLAEYTIKNRDGSDDATAAVVKLIRT